MSAVTNWLSMRWKILGKILGTVILVYPAFFILELGSYDFESGKPMLGSFTPVYVLYWVLMFIFITICSVVVSVAIWRDDNLNLAKKFSSYALRAVCFVIVSGLIVFGVRIATGK